MDEALTERWRSRIRSRFLDFLDDADPSDVSVYFSDETGEDGFIVEWLSGPDQWSYGSYAPGSILAGTYTTPWDLRSMLVVIIDPTAVDQ